METKTCQNCKQNFTIETEDFLFYEKIKVPPPTFCPTCRMKRRTNFRNLCSLYRWYCDLCGRSIIAMYHTEETAPIYCSECWNSDKWDATSYGQDYDFSRPFFEQWNDLY